MNRQKKRFVMFLVPLAVIFLASFLAAQGPPNSCADACLQAYRNTVIACHGEAACLAAARADFEGLHPRLQPGAATVIYPVRLAYA